MRILGGVVLAVGSVLEGRSEGFEELSRYCFHFVWAGHIVIGFTIYAYAVAVAGWLWWLVGGKIFR
jgi:hypothetical protein